MEAEDKDGALASVRGQLADGAGPEELRHQLLLVASAHHLSYGHGIIYTQKAFELLDRLGWDRAPDLLPHLDPDAGAGHPGGHPALYGPAMGELAAVDLDALAAAPGPELTGWSSGPDGAGAQLTTDLLDATAAPMARAAAAVGDGAGIDGLLDAVVDAVSLRLLRHDLEMERDTADGFGWLDITHGLTMAEAARWAWRVDPGPHTARLALFATWLLFDTGRAERRRTRGRGRRPEPAPATLDGVTGGSAAGPASASILAGSWRRRWGRDGPTTPWPWPSGPTARRWATRWPGPPSTTGPGRSSWWRTWSRRSRPPAGRLERRATSLPLAAAARFLAAPRRERFVARNVAESIGFLRTGRPPRR